MIVPHVVVLAIAVAVNAGLFYRLLVGRTPFDRLLAATAIGTNAVVLLVLIGFVFERPDAFVDLALSYALLNFIGTVAVGKYLETRQHQLWSLMRGLEEEEDA
ncbi:MAG: monovalent cation/H+ antiporter complex subunit F [Chloroflexota bacterium]|nr:monovalent cation/H+ antiporter complex subunit F [Chloroflexota bacterium]MDE2885817.1 monovalent cation/H+ antiporter complex subunit F [Chloroflexota bacterium]